MTDGKMSDEGAVPAEAAVGASVGQVRDSIRNPIGQLEPQPSVAEAANPVVEAGHPAGVVKARRNVRRLKVSFGLSRFSGLYVWAALIVLFSILLPETFATTANIKVILGEQAITAMLALGILLPLAAGTFDLSFASVLGVSVAITSYVQSHGYNAWLAALAALAAGLFIGAVNGFVVVKLNVSSFIATLGMSSILVAAEYWITNGQQITKGFSSSFLNLGLKQYFGIPLPFFVMIIVAIILYIVIEYRPVGRRLYAVGGNPQAARLAGIRVDRIIFGSLLMSSLIASFTGIVLAAQLGLASPDIGPSYLLPAFSAVFLGSTQIKAGRVNVLGTLIGIYLLATGVQGLQLAGAPVYLSDFFNGAALIVAVALAARSARRV